MEVAFSSPLSQPHRRTPVPLRQLVEESRSESNIPNHLLDSKIYGRLKSNGLIQTEPSELHFTGFDLGRDHVRTLKIINVSSEVMDVHIISTQTEYFRTTYSKKSRLIPGLAYTLKVCFCPDEWRYYYDSIRVHCKGEENLLVPVHAYPVIDDLQIPPHIHLSAVPLGQRVSHAIPLKCSCPIDFEFQVFVIQPHEAFSISPLKGLIPANGEVKIIVTFRPLQYETCQVTIQLIISQFNTKPYLCTITGSSAPNMGPSQLGRKVEDATPVDNDLPLPATTAPRYKSKHMKLTDGGKPKTLKSLASVKPAIDVCAHAGVAKMLIKDSIKPSSEDLSPALICLQNRKLKESLFMKKVQQNMKELQAKHLRQSHVGEDPLSEDRRRQIVAERETALRKYLVDQGEAGQDVESVARQPKLSSKRLLFDAGLSCEADEGAPSFQPISSFHPELRRRALRLFQQAARKVVIRVRMNRRLTCLKKLSDGLMESPPGKQTCDEGLSADLVHPCPPPVFCVRDVPLALSRLDSLPVGTTVTVTTHLPLFNLQSPQHYKLMGYQAVSAWEAFDSYIPTALARQLRTADLTEALPESTGARSPTADLQTCEEQSCESKEEDVEACADYSLTFTAPQSLLRPSPANPLRIFNPAPGLQSFKRPPKYPENDLDFHLCPVPRYVSPGADARRQHPDSQRTFLDRQLMLRRLLSGQGFDPDFSRLSDQSALSCGCAFLRSFGCDSDLLSDPPPPLTDPPDDLTQHTDLLYKGSGVKLSPEMISAEFLSWKAPGSNTNHDRGVDRRHRGAAASGSEPNQMGRRVMTRLAHLTVPDRDSPRPAGDDGKVTPTHSHTKTSR
ncbi:cilia- and flagella-associated protein 221 [Cheilinus undulatus]|uniref:cilia- and flagella-associated protein 221 n=1 Tax=Cheilinus undulatus TaxID=241271 RepID=UPI001BD1E448|nr:cilia- and flagella-associated protein 221 [Cheilinus undulatus]